MSRTARRMKKQKQERCVRFLITETAITNRCVCTVAGVKAKNEKSENVKKGAVNEI